MALFQKSLQKNQMVYGLYGLSEEEIKIVEGLKRFR